MTGHYPFPDSEGSGASVDSRRYIRGSLLLLTLATFAWRLHWLDRQSYWRDEVDAVYFALRHLPDTLAMFVQAGQNGALYFLALRPWLGAVGSAEFALRFPSALFGTVTVPLVWLVAHKLIPTHSQQNRPGYLRFLLGNAPLLTALFLAVNPYQLWYSQEGKMYSLATLLATLAVLLFMQAIHQNRRRQWWALLLTVSVAIYTHLLMILLIPLLVVLALIAWPVSRHRLTGMLLVLCGLTLPYIPMLIWQWDLLLSAEKKTGFSRVTLLDAATQVLMTQTQAFIPSVERIWLLPFFVFGLAGLLIGFLEIRPPVSATGPALTPWRRHLMVVAWLLTPLLTIHLMSLRQPIFTPRYIIWIAPAAMMLLALGIQLIWHTVDRPALPFALLLVTYLFGFWLYAGWQQKFHATKYDLRSAVALIADQRTPDTLLILQIPHMEWAYRLYSSDLGTAPFVGSNERLGSWAAGLWTNNGLPEQNAVREVARQMMSMTAGKDEVWLLSSEVEMWDARRLMNQWLTDNGEVVETYDFHGAQARRYRLR